jgi:hypothetical protein
MYYVYLLYSEKIDKYYIGQTNSLKDRVNRHNENRCRSTKNKGPWILIGYGIGLPAYRRDNRGSSPLGSARNPMFILDIGFFVLRLADTLIDSTKFLRLLISFNQISLFDNSLFISRAQHDR